jgi:excisionase family DNA binding protein
MSTIPTSISTSTHPRLTREDVLDGRDVAELLHLPISTVLEYARRGLLPGHKLGRRWIFLRDEIEAAVRGRPGDRSAA